MGFMSLFLSRDMLGHPLTINYKGDTNFNTKLGAFLSIGIQVMVLYILIDLTIDMIQMNDPSILSYKRPLYEEEVDEFGEINLEEYRFNFGVYFTSGPNPIDVPAEIGRVVSVIYTEGPDKKAS